MQKKERLKELLQSGSIKSIEDINNLVKDIYKETLETMLEAELEAELGYSRYDDRNKKTRIPATASTQRQYVALLGRLN